MGKRSKSVSAPRGRGKKAKCVTNETNPGISSIANVNTRQKSTSNDRVSETVTRNVNNSKGKIDNNTRKSNDEVALVETQFSENNQRVQMSVTITNDQINVNEVDQLMESELSDDDVVELRPPANESFNEMSEEAIDHNEFDENASQRSQDNSQGRYDSYETTHSSAKARRRDSNLLAEAPLPCTSAESDAEKIRKIDIEMTNKLKELHDLMSEEGMDESVEMVEKCAAILKSKQRRSRSEDAGTGENRNLNASNLLHQSKRGVTLPPPVTSNSEETIYESAVPKRNSSSSEDELTISPPNQNVTTINCNKLNTLFAEGKGRNSKTQGRIGVDDGDVRRFPPWEEDGEHHNCDQDNEEQLLPDEPEPNTEERIRNMIQQVEASKARMFAATGNERFLSPSAVIDKGYVVVGGHLDEITVNKLKSEEYVDFGKLIPRDRVVDEDGKMEMYVKNGRTFWMPVSHTVSINSFARWEQAFRVFPNIYCKANPHRASELIEYNHVIHTIAMAYTWDNVYTYDKEFRMHMARNPHRSWAIILQQAWSLRLMDRIFVSNNQ